MKRFFIALTRNPISLLGTAITTASAVLIFALFAIELVGYRGGPYLGILAFLVLPAFFALGLILIPIGILRERRRARRAAERGEPAPLFPVIDLNKDRTRRWVVTFVVLTLVNLVILAAATYKGVEVMESPQFCGETCHSVMAPEYTAYQRAPHAQVACVDCHIGPGAAAFAHAKLNGAWQVVSTNFNLYHRPITLPNRDRANVQGTCSECHWPPAPAGDKLRVITKFQEDEANTEVKTVLALHLGSAESGRSHGIHWHADPQVQVRFRADEARQTVYEVEVTRPDGSVKLFLPPDGAKSPEEGGEWQVMGCLDCHNRPSHTFRLPAEELDLALEQGRLDRSLPFLRQQGMQLLTAGYASHEAASAAITSGLAAFYRDQHPDVAAAQSDAISAAGEELSRIYSWNVFPSMNVDWGTYPRNIGHENFPGCFRCHDEEHATEDGETLSQDCFACHSLPAVEEENPDVLQQLEI